MAIKIAGTEVINDNKELVLAKLTEINSSIADTAVDVFVYDTSKDSDGGAWRKRTQGTSWYNETLNTATRGSRREFPAVAVIVTETNQVTIYDGDDPSLPMWMVFNRAGDSYFASSSTLCTSVSFFNGLLVFGVGTGTREISFLKDSAQFRTNSGKNKLSQPISGRNSGNTGLGYDGNALVNSNVNDVAMTVLPNAPIDAATGLPVPTIAVATNGGVSVIKDDGTVVDSSVTSVGFDNVGFIGNALYVARKSHMNFYVYSSFASDGFAHDYIANSNYTAGDAVAIMQQSATDIEATASSSDTIYIGADNGEGLKVALKEEDNTLDNVTYITSTYNTGWMNGDIKLATLSDTDNTDVTGSELVTNGTFDSDTSGWALVRDGIGTAVQNSGTLVMTSDGNKTYMSQQISVESGKKYILTFDVVAASGLGSFDSIMGFGSSSGSVSSYTRAYTAGSYHHYYTADSSSVYVTVGLPSTSESGDSITLDNISVTEVEEDRSVNGSGLQVFGTVTKNPVATGADLVAYSGFSSSNYLEQPYNSDLDFGTGDFCVMGWVKPSSVTVTSVIFDRGNGSNNTNRLVIYASNADLRFQINAADYAATSALSLNTWKYVTLVRSNGVTKLYLNGEVGVSTSGATGSVDSGGVTRLGVSQTLTNPTNGYLALWRISATAPSPEQIARIYNDEKHLFTEGAQATLYGSSDSVTALAYDTDSELLHVGTSAGRSVFQGLRRVDNTTTAVTSAISASNGLVADE